MKESRRKISGTEESFGTPWTYPDPLFAPEPEDIYERFASPGSGLQCAWLHLSPTIVGFREIDRFFEDFLIFEHLKMNRSNRIFCFL
jgi:hypothetical protein